MSHRFELMVLRVRKLLDIPPQHPVHSLPTLRPISGRKPGRSQGKGKLKAASIPPASAGHVLIRGKNPPHQHPPRPTTRPQNQTTTPGSNTPGSPTTRPAHHQTATQHRHRATQQPLQALPITGPSPAMSSTSRRRSPLPPDWHRIRSRILERDNHTCQLRIHCAGSPATEVHHTAGPDDHRDEVLIAACKPCHATTTGRDAARARAVKYGRRRAPEPHPGRMTPGG